MSVTSLNQKRSHIASAPALQTDLPRLNFEVSDLFYYYGNGSTPTGIQRVQQELCLQFLESRANTPSTIVIYDKSLQKWRIVPGEWFVSLIQAARSFKTGRDKWQKTYQSFATQLT